MSSKSLMKADGSSLRSKMLVDEINMEYCRAMNDIVYRSHVVREADPQLRDHNEISREEVQDRELVESLVTVGEQSVYRDDSDPRVTSLQGIIPLDLARDARSGLPMSQTFDFVDSFGDFAFQTLYTQRLVMRILERFEMSALLSSRREYLCSPEAQHKVKDLKTSKVRRRTI